MRKLLKPFLLLLIILALVLQTSFAANIVTLYGTTNSTEDITILVLKEGTNTENIKNEDIAYVNQEKVNADGSFILELPFDSIESYIVRSNKNFNIFNGERNKTVYVSAASGSDLNDGETAETPLKTLESAFGKLFMANEIVVMDDMALSLPASTHDAFTIKGNTPAVKLTLPAEISLAGNLCIDNITLDGASTIYANGFKLKIGTGAASADTAKRLTVYGGKNGATFDGNTDIELLGGHYSAVYGGGNSGKVNGNTKVVFGGNANSGDGIDDDADGVSPCKVYGGGNNAAVTGKTNVTLSGNAVTKYVIGAGTGTNGTAIDTNIYVDGGKAMNVYGGSHDASLTNCEIHIMMTGGVVEALFGGCEKVAMSGNVYITVKGGEVTRRIYTGCYNDWEYSWKSSNYVTGTTNLMLYPEANLSLNTDSNRGVFAGSRIDSSQSAEHNTIIFMDDCYNSFKSKIGDVSGFGFIFKSFVDYTVKANDGGDVYGTSTGGTIKIVPDTGYKGTVSGIATEYLTEGLATLTSNTATVTFERAADYLINSLTAEKSENAVSGEADIIGSTVANEPRLVVVIYDYETGMMIACGAQPAENSGEKPFNLNCNLESGRRYIVKAMIWDSELKPLTNCYTIDL